VNGCRDVQVSGLACRLGKVRAHACAWASQSLNT
jgi:hypothetical protein